MKQLYKINKGNIKNLCAEKNLNTYNFLVPFYLFFDKVFLYQLREFYIKNQYITINFLFGEDLFFALNILFGIYNVDLIYKEYKIIIKDIGCNARCPICIDWKNKINLNINRKNLFKAINIIIKEKIPFKKLQILGGEPLIIYDDILKIVGMCKKNNMEMDFPTNASLLTIKRIEELIGAGLNNFTFSIDFPDDKQDTWRKLPGVFNKIVTFTNYIKSKGLKVQWNTVIGSFNNKIIVGFQDLYKTSYPDIHNIIEIENSGGDYFKYKLNKKQLGEVKIVLEKLKKKNLFIKYDINGFDYLNKNFSDKKINKPCYLSFYKETYGISITGVNKVPCYFGHRKKIGNIQEFKINALEGKCKEDCDSSYKDKNNVYYDDLIKNFLEISKKYSFPNDIMIEVTNNCNLKCVTCYSHQDCRTKQFMDFKIFKKIIDEIPLKEYKTLSLYNYGEPLLHPKIGEFINYAKESGIKNIKISTNGHFLTPEIGENIIQGGLDYLSISIDGATQDAYEKFRKGGDLKIVLINLIRFIKLRKNIGYGPIVEIQFIIMEHNKHQISLIEKLAKKIGVDFLRLKTVLIKEQKWKDLDPKDKYSRYMDLHNINYCYKPINGIVVNVDGTVIPCCYFTGKDIFKFKLGNIKKTNLEDLYNGIDNTKFLNKVTTDKSKISGCKNCNEGNLNLDYKVIKLI